MSEDRIDHRIHILPHPAVSSLNELSDTSGPLFSIYSKTVEDDDNQNSERHQKDAEGIVLFTGLFSAALASLITVSIQDLRPSPQDKSTFYLENIYQFFADPNVSRASIHSTVVTPPPFSPPRFAIWVNTLWISSLAISLTSALLATLLQQWTRRYMTVARPLGSPQKRARIRQFFFNGASSLHFLLASDAVPTLLHFSVFLFFAGLLILLRNINHTVFNTVALWVMLCVAVYAYITLLPIFHPASPHYTPLSSLAWQLYADARSHVFKLLSVRKGIYNGDSHLPARLLKRLEEKTEEIVLGRTPELDALILESLPDNLCEDRGREKFFEAIPGFFNSRMVQVQDVKRNLSSMFITKFRLLVDQFLESTLTSDSISELTRSRRLFTCMKATHVVLGCRAGTGITDRIIRSGNWNEVPPSPEIGHILIRWHKSTDIWISTLGSCMISRIIASVGIHDDTWMALTMSQLGVTEKVLKRYRRHGDSVLLANLIQTTRLFFEKGLQFQDILRSISGFSVKDTLPELQREFCTLWNDIVRSVQDRQKIGCSIDSIFILQEIYLVYNALHPTAPTAVAAPAPTAAFNDGLYLGFFHPCADPQSHHLPIFSRQGTSPSTNKPSAKFDIPHASQPTSPVSTLSSSPLWERPLPYPLQCNETNFIPHAVPDNPSSPVPLAPLGELPAVVHNRLPLALEPSHSKATSYACALLTPAITPRVSVSDLNISTSTSRPGRSVV